MLFYRFILLCTKGGLPGLNNFSINMYLCVINTIIIFQAYFLNSRCCNYNLLNNNKDYYINVVFILNQCLAFVGIFCGKQYCKFQWFKMKEIDFLKYFLNKCNNLILIFSVCCNLPSQH